MEFYTVTLQHTYYYNYGYSVIDGDGNNKIYRLKDDEQEWIEIDEIPEKRGSFGVASLNGKIYITGGWRLLIVCKIMYHYIFSDGVFKSCLCFDPSSPVDNRISKIDDMNYARYNHSLIAANGKLYAIGG